MSRKTQDFTSSKRGEIEQTRTGEGRSEEERFRLDNGEAAEILIGHFVVRDELDRSAERIHQHGVMSCVRTYESPLERRFEEHDMTAIASVSLLIKEAVVRVEEPSLVPAL